MNLPESDKNIYEYAIFLHVQSFLKKVPSYLFFENNKYRCVPCGFSYTVQCKNKNTNSDANCDEEYASYIGEDCIEEFWKQIEITGDKLVRKIANPQIVPNFVIVTNINMHYCEHLLVNKLPLHATSEIERRDNHSDLKQIETINVCFRNFSLKFQDCLHFVGSTIDNIRRQIVETEMNNGDSPEIQRLKMRIDDEVPFPVYFQVLFEKLDSTIRLEKNLFYKMHCKEDISDEEYAKARAVWTENMTLREYLVIFFKSAVYFLQNTFQYYRNLYLKHYNYDFLHSSEIKTLYDLMLKTTNHSIVELDVETERFLLPNIQCPMTILCGQPAMWEAHNLYHFNSNYYSEKPFFLNIFNAKHALKWAMSQYLPHSNFSWLNQNEINDLQAEITNIPENNEFGFIFEVDLFYPPILHDSHKVLRFCNKVNWKYYAQPVSANKYNLVVHYRHLQLCLENGLILKKIHRVLKFKQKKWLMNFVNYNIQLHNQAESSLESNLFHNLIDRQFISLLVKVGKVKKPLFYLSFGVFELHRYFIYNFHYNQMLNKYKQKATLLQLDINLFFYKIETNDFYEDLQNDEDFKNLFFDTTRTNNNNNDKQGSSIINIDELHKIEDLTHGKIVTKCFCLKSDCYCYIIDGVEFKRSRNIRTYCRKNEITKNDYKKCIERRENCWKYVWDNSFESYGTFFEYKRTKVLQIF